MNGIKELTQKLQRTSQLIVEKNGCALMLSIPFSPFPNLFWGFRLNRALSKFCASWLRNCGMPSLALQDQGKKEANKGNEIFTKGKQVWRLWD